MRGTGIRLLSYSLVISAANCCSILLEAAFKSVPVISNCLRCRM